MTTIAEEKIRALESQVVFFETMAEELELELHEVKQFTQHLVEMVEEVVSPPRGANKTQWIQNFIKEVVKDKLNQHSQQEPICPRSVCTGCPDEQVCDTYDVREGEDR